MKKILLPLLLNIQFVFAQEVVENESISSALSGQKWEPNYFAMLFGLFLVIGLVYLTAFAYQKLLKIKFDTSNEKINAPQIVATTPLGQNKNLHVVKVNNEYVLIGSTQSTITYIKDIDYNE